MHASQWFHFMLWHLRLNSLLVFLSHQTCAQGQCAKHTVWVIASSRGLVQATEAKASQ